MVEQLGDRKEPNGLRNAELEEFGGDLKKIWSKQK